MRTRIEETSSRLTPEQLALAVRDVGGMIVLKTGSFTGPAARFSFVTALPLITFRTWGSRCETQSECGRSETQFGNPWEQSSELISRFEVLEDANHMFPLGGCFGYWGYDLKQFVEPRLSRRAVNDLDLPDCHLGFYGSLVVFDHLVGKNWIIATGLTPDGSRSDKRLESDLHWWRKRIREAGEQSRAKTVPIPSIWEASKPRRIISSHTRDQFIAAVDHAQKYIRSGDIYQVNLAQRLGAACPDGGWNLFDRLAAVSAAPFSAYMDCGDYEFVSSSPELFLRMSDRSILTRPIKGTRPRSSDPGRDAQLSAELQQSPKEHSELVMITDLLRNDLGRVCKYGSIHVPELATLERYSHVQHLVSTIHGELTGGTTHLEALAACFPGGSITGAPKIRAMEIIDELEPVTRGPYCGCHGYLGFNQETTLSVTIRTAVVRDGVAWFHVGAGIVADSDAESEYEETLAKGRGWMAAIGLPSEAPGIAQR
jgi:para-aminobenzoate synthetase component 1